MYVKKIHPDMSYRMYLKLWIEQKEKEVQPSTIERYKRRIRLYIEEELGDFGLEEIDEDVVMDFIEDVTATIPQQPYTVENVHHILHNSFEWAIQQGVIQENPAAGIVLAKRNRQDYQLWDESLIEDYLEEIKKQPGYPIFLLVLTEGVSQAEALALTWKDVKFLKRTISITKSITHDGKTVKKLDGNRAKFKREITIGENTVLELKRVQKRQIREEIYNPMQLIAPSGTGTPIQPRNILRTHHQNCEKLGIPKNSFKELRHSYVLNALLRGVSPININEKLGFVDMEHFRNYELYIDSKLKVEINQISKGQLNKNVFTRL